jgi:hypothetical protein
LRRAPAGVLLACALGANAQYAAAQFQPKSDWEEKQDRLNWKPNQLKLPAWHKADALIEFQVSSASAFRFYIDAASLSVAGDGVVRYTLVARSPSGFENVSYEGIRCESNTYVVFAHGNDGKWREVPPDWKRIELRDIARWRNVLHADLFCPAGAIIASADEGLRALRQGYHPSLRVVPGNPSR